jgi:hypothetical protein
MDNKFTKLDKKYNKIQTNIRDTQLIMNHLEKMQTLCKHEYVEDLIDITPDKSQTIYYCKHCLHCKENT